MKIILPHDEQFLMKPPWSPARKAMALIAAFSLFPLSFLFLVSPELLPGLMPKSLTSIPAHLAAHSPAWIGIALAIYLCAGAMWIPFANVWTKKAWLGFASIVLGLAFLKPCLKSCSDRNQALAMTAVVCFSSVGILIIFLRPLRRS